MAKAGIMFFGRGLILLGCAALVVSGDATVAADAPVAAATNAPAQAAPSTATNAPVAAATNVPAQAAPSTATNAPPKPAKRPEWPPGVPNSPDVLPGNGLAQHPFLYTGEWDTRKPDAQSMFIVRGGKIVWQYSIPMKAARGGVEEFDDVTMLPDGNILFSRMSGAGIVTPDKKLVWEYNAPLGTEVHSAQSIGKDRVLIMRNGNPAQAMIFNTASNTVEKVIPIPTTIKGTHGQFRHIRMTPAGTILVPHMSEGKVVEYDLNGNVVWSVKEANVWGAVRLKNGNTLVSTDARCSVLELNPKGETVWEFNQSDVPNIRLLDIQGAYRLANGNTVMCNWCSGKLGKTPADWPSTVQVLEVTPDKKVVWALRSWQDPADLGTATEIQLLDQPPGSDQR